MNRADASDSLSDHGFAPEIGRPVIDQTGLKGVYNLHLQWARPQNPDAILRRPDGANPGMAGAPTPDSSGPSLLTVIEEQLGLKLKPTKGPVEFVVVEHVDKPTAN